MSNITTNQPSFEQIETARITKKIETFLALPQWVADLFERAGVVLQKARMGFIAEYNHLFFEGPKGSFTMFVGQSLATGRWFQEWNIEGQRVEFCSLVSWLEG